MDTRTFTAELPESSEAIPSTYAWGEVRDTVAGRGRLLSEANKLAAADGSPEAQKRARELTDVIIALARKKPAERDAMLADIRGIVAPLGLDIVPANEYEVPGASSEITEEEHVSPSPVPEAVRAEETAADHQPPAPQEGSTRPTPQFNTPVDTPAEVSPAIDTAPAPVAEAASVPSAPAVETIASPEAGFSLEEMKAEIETIRSAVKPEQYISALATNPEYVRALNDWLTLQSPDAAPIETVRDIHHRLTEAAWKFPAEASPGANQSPAPEAPVAGETVRWGEPAEPPTPPINEVSTEEATEEGAHQGALPPVVDMPQYTQPSVAVSAEAALTAETPTQEDIQHVPPANEGVGDASSEATPSIEIPTQPPAAGQEEGRAGVAGQEREEQFVNYRMKIDPNDRVMPGGIVLGTPEQPAAAPDVSGAEMTPPDMGTPQEHMTAPSVSAEAVEASAEPVAEEPMLEPAAVEAAVPANDIEAPAIRQPFDESILEDPEVSGGLAELMDGWPGFDKSGLLGFGAHGIKHPAYIKLANRPMGELLAQEESAERAA